MDSIDRALGRLPRNYPGPGGAAAIIKDGAVLARHSWGWANAEQRIPFTPRTLFRMCSITKQFTCAALLDSVPDPASLDAAIRARLPNLQCPAPTTLQLAHNQSGLRDYWAVAMLHGAPAEGAFSDVDATNVIEATRTLHFPPGTAYSYVNQNFRLLSDVLESHTGRGFAELLRPIFDRAGMHTALLAADTRALPDGSEGYEGTQATGFRPAVNRILWTGDAGLGASLDDMIGWERHIDATRDDPTSLYNRLSTPVTFADGAPAAYGFGLGRHKAFGRAATSHGGALRGWRSHRIHLAAERISAVVLFNHLSDARQAALDLLAAVLGATPDQAPSPQPAPPWVGAYFDPETRLSARIEAAAPGHVRLRFGHTPELLRLHPDGSAGAAEGTRLEMQAGVLHMHRPQENTATTLTPFPPGPEAIPEGRFHCRELDATLTLAAPGGTLYGAFSGRLGNGRMELLDPIGAGAWALPCPRALDHTPPGDWTLALRPGGSTIDVGCWLARALPYERVQGAITGLT